MINLTLASSESVVLLAVICVSAGAQGPNVAKMTVEGDMRAIRTCTCMCTSYSYTIYFRSIMELRLVRLPLISVVMCVA